MTALLTAPQGTDDADYSARVNGTHYVSFIETLHQTLTPRTYLDVGTLSGGTLKVAKCASIAIDPKFHITTDVLGPKPSCFFFQEPSDTFFRHRNPEILFGNKIDMAFLDGMHLFEFLLRDFINTEKYCSKDSLIILHDCLPPGFYMTSRNIEDAVRGNSKFAKWWTGDVWKVVPVLRKYRPDLSITVTVCTPTGLVLITNLDPMSSILKDSYGEITKTHSKAVMNRDEYDEYWNGVRIVSSDESDTLAKLKVKHQL